MKKFKLLFILFISIFTAQISTAQNGLDFDGSNDYVQTTYSGVLGPSPRTFEAWVKIPTSPTSNLSILDYGVNLAGSRNTFVIRGDDKLGFISGGTNANITASTVTVPANQWVHLAFVFDGNNGFLYQDGVQVGTGNLSSVNTPSGGDLLKIGERVSGGSIPFEGTIDEVRIWNSARTQAEIQANMNAEFCSIPTGLVAYYQMNQGTAGASNTGLTNLIDNSGAGNNGTLNNFALNGSTSNWVMGNNLSTTAVTFTQTLVECAGYSITVGSNIYNQTGVYLDTLVGASAGGCDSIVTTDLTINTGSATFVQTLNECPGFSITVGNNSYNQTGTYIDTLVGMAANGCDSIVTTELTMNSVATFNQSFTECPGFSISVGVHTYTQPGTYMDTLVAMAANGCDAIISSTITELNPSFYSQVFDECPGFSITVGNNTYSQTGNFTDTLVNAIGCDSIVSTNLVVDTAIDLTIQTNGFTLTADTTATAYQWLDCDNNYAVIVNETSQSFTATANGNYAVAITSGNCTDTSTCQQITGIFTVQNESMEFIEIYPNPIRNSLNINLLHNTTEVHVDLIDLMGRTLTSQKLQQNTNRLDFSAYPSGVYFIKVKNDKVEQIYKLIKQ